MQSLLIFDQLELYYPNRLLLGSFSYSVYEGEKIAIIGDNGCGKSSILKLIASLRQNPVSEITLKDGVVPAYIPQIITEYDRLSGAERFNQALSLEIAKGPDLLLLDEPTNHLDSANRKSLLNMLAHSSLTMIIATHDTRLLNSGLMDTLWHIHDQQITVFHGSYAAYLHEREAGYSRLEQELDTLNKARHQQHLNLMKEQKRAKSSRLQGEKSIVNRKWPTITSGAKARRAESTSGKNNAALRQQKQQIDDKLAKLWQPEELAYKFSLSSVASSCQVVTINNGSCHYHDSAFGLDAINLGIAGNERVALCGVNGSGKSTLVRAMMRDSAIICDGEWLLPPLAEIAYLDQHYSALPSGQTVIEVLATAASHLDYSALRDFLNKFLFRKNEEVNKPVVVLSGGEKARLSLALIALRQPKLLILDEVSNNIDLRTRNHIGKLLCNYPGALIVISHDQDFLEEIGISRRYTLN